MDQTSTLTHGSDTPTQEKKDRDRPPHLPQEDSIFPIPEFIVMEQLYSVSGPLSDFEIPSEAEIDLS